MAGWSCNAGYRSLNKITKEAYKSKQRILFGKLKFEKNWKENGEISEEWMLAEGRGPCKEEEEVEEKWKTNQ